MSAPIETKVKASTAGAAAGGVITGFAVWVADAIWWNGDAPPDVPLPVMSMIALVVGAASAFVPGYLAKHTRR